MVLSSGFSPILLGANLFCESAFTTSSVFQFNTGGDENLCKSRDPPSTQSASPIHNSIGRAFSCTVALELSNPPFSYAVLAKSFSPIEKLSSCSFLRQNVFLPSRNLCCVQSLATEADATASHWDPTCQPKVTS